MMWRSEEQVSSEQLAVSSKTAARLAREVASGQWPVISKNSSLLATGHRPPATSFVLLFAVCCLLFAPACRRDMQDQPKMKPFRSSTFFRDGLSARPPIEGTVARGFLKEDTEFYTGKRAGRTAAKTPGNAPSESAGGPQPSASGTGAALQGAAAYPDDVELFPITITKDTVTRGKERYEIFCSACHGLTGSGDGMIVRRGFRRAASFNDDRLRQAPVGHFFDAITNGWGAMPSYAPQIPPEDRWAIIAYIRALQVNQQNQTQSGPAAAATPGNAASGRHQ